MRGSTFKRCQVVGYYRSATKHIGTGFSYVVTAEEWNNIKLHIPRREHVWERPRQACLYVLQYDTVWDYV